MKDKIAHFAKLFSWSKTELVAWAECLRLVVIREIAEMQGTLHRQFYHRNIVANSGRHTDTDTPKGVSCLSIVCLCIPMR